MSKEYRTWRQRFIRDRLQLAIWIAMGFLVIITVLNLGMLLPALERSGEEDPFLNAERFWLLAWALLITPELGLVINWLLLRYLLPIHRIQVTFLGYSIALVWIPQIYFTLKGEAFLDFGVWLIFFTLQALLIPVKWSWHLLSQALALTLLLISILVFQLSVVGLPESMWGSAYWLFTIIAISFFFMLDLGVFLYERMLLREFDLRQRLQLFLHAVSHDLRNPVTGTLMLLQTIGTDNRGDYTIPSAIMEKIVDSHQRQLQLINSLLEVHAQEVQGIPLKPQWLYLSSFVQTIVSDFLPLAQSMSSRITLLIASDLPAVWADPLHLRRVYENIISNALQYNRPGLCILLNAKVQGSYLHCTISDNGQGMNRTECQRIFDRYSRGSRSRQPLHLGLGLYICQQIIESHHGQIGVESQPEQGTTFWFTLPLEATQAS